jgi:DnaJ-class molecular chaperone
MSEAYAVLGVNPDVSEGVLKKIVDALRMSWHPDHARDEEDRLAREDRMRQINIAWDLISGARGVA